MAEYYSFIEIEPVNGSPAYKVIMPMGKSIVLRLSNPHEKMIFETINDAKHSIALQQRYKEEHEDFTFEKMKA